MKKIFTLAAFALVLASSVQAQTYNLFPSWAVDADGWLWFNSQDKIDAFVGDFDKDSYKANPNGKIIQMAEADYDPYQSATVSITEVGVGGQGNDAAVGGPGHRTGAIVLPKASKINTANGGGILLMLPSLATLSLSVSCANTMTVMVRASRDISPTITNYEMMFSSYNFRPFKILSSAGIYTWNSVETLTNTQSQTIVSTTPICVFIQNTTTSPMYIHGIKVTTPNQETTGINSVVSSGDVSTTAVYGVDGLLIKRDATADDVKSLNKGLYIMRSGSNSRKIVVK